MSINISQAEVSALIPVGQFAVIDSEQVEDSGIAVVDVHGSRRPVLLLRFRTHRCAIRVGDVIPVVVALSVGNPGLDSTPGHPGCETSGMMITPVVLLGQSALAIRGTPEFSSPDNEGFIKHSSLLQVRNESVGSPVNIPALGFVLPWQASMGVPSTVENLDISDTSFGEAPGVQAAGIAAMPLAAEVEVEGERKAPVAVAPSEDSVDPPHS